MSRAAAEKLAVFVKSVRGSDTARASIVFMVVRVLGMAATFASQVLLARWLGADLYGAYTYAFSWALIFSMLAGLGLPSSTVRFIPHYIAKRDFALLKGALKGHRVASIAFSTLVAAGLALFLEFAIAPRVDPQLGMHIGFAALLVPPLTIAILEGEQARALGGTFSAFIPNNLLRPLVLTLSVGAASSLFRVGNRTTLVSACVAFFVVALAQHMWLRLITPDTGPARLAARYEWREWLSASLPLLLVAGFHLLIERVDILMLGSLTDAASTGAYAAASRTASMLTFFLVAVNSALVPRISRLVALQQYEEVQRLLSKYSRWVFFPSLATYIVLASAAGPIMMIFGEGFGEAARLPLIALGLAHLLSATCGPVSHVLNIAGHQNKSLVIYGGALLANVALNYSLIPRYGAFGAAIATAASILVWNLAQLLAVRYWLRLSTTFLLRPPVRR